MNIPNIFKPPKRPKPSGDAAAGELNDQNLFESYPHGTLALMAAGCGFIAVATLAIELVTANTHAMALEIPVRYLSLPLGVGTMILAGLTARANWLYALPALAFGAIYWVICAAGLLV